MCSSLWRALCRVAGVGEMVGSALPTTYRRLEIGLPPTTFFPESCCFQWILGDHDHAIHRLSPARPVPLPGSRRLRVSPCPRVPTENAILTVNNLSKRANQGVWHRNLLVRSDEGHGHRVPGRASGSFRVYFFSPDGARTLLQELLVTLFAVQRLKRSVDNSGEGRPPWAWPRRGQAPLSPPYAVPAHCGSTPCAAALDDNNPNRRTTTVANAVHSGQ